MYKMMNLLLLRLKIMFNHKSFWLIFILITLLVSILVSELFSQVEKGVKIPVGIVDLDKSDFSEYVIDQLSINDLIDIRVLDESSVDQLVKDQTVEAVYIITKGAEKKVIQGNIIKLIEVVYLDENYFTMMLTDILSGDFLDEICIYIASRYYVDGYNKFISDSSVDIFNDVYDKGHDLTNINSENYYIDIELIGDNNKSLDFYNQSIVLEKMTIGIVYIFIGFFILFEGLHIIRDRSSDVYNRMKLSGVSVLILNISELMSLIVAGLLITIPLTIVSLYYGKEMFSVIIINCLFNVSMSSFIYLFLHIIKGIKGYILVGTSVIIGMGIVSGSFFSIDVNNSIIRLVAQMLPTYYSVNAYFDRAIISDYLVYTLVFTVIVTSLCLIIDRKLIKE